MNLTREEQETVIRATAADSTWDVCTADPRIIRRMERLGYQPDDRKNPWGYVSFTVPFDRVKIKPAVKRKPTGRPFQSKAHANSHSPEDQNPPDMVGQGGKRFDSAESTPQAAVEKKNGF